MWLEERPVFNVEATYTKKSTIFLSYHIAGG